MSSMTTMVLQTMYYLVQKNGEQDCFFLLKFLKLFVAPAGEYSGHEEKSGRWRIQMKWIFY